MNSINVIGRLTKDIDLRYTDNGTPVAKFGLAVDGYKDHTNFFSVQVWGKQAENCAKYIGKGRLVGISGELRQERWEKEGQSRSRVVINGRNVKFLDYASEKDQEETAPDDIMEDDFDVPF